MYFRNMSVYCLVGVLILKQVFYFKSSVAYLGVRFAGSLDVQVSSLAGPGAMALHKATPKAEKGVHADVQTSLTLLITNTRDDDDNDITQFQQ